ncbi:MAG: tetratricopeptide repeat protein, partial [Acidobacteriota bacterium]|nr:tetratricopeptide repeat protein [Acidobacteriota bacterium]
MQRGDFQKAMESYGRGLKIAQELGNVENEVDCLLHMGVLSWNDRKIKESSDYNMQALSLAKRFNLKKMLWEAQQINDIIRLYYRGKELRSKRQHSQSIKSFERAIDLAKKIESREYELKCLRQMSITYWEIFEVKRFFALNEKALRLAKELKHKREEGSCLNNIGLYYFKINDYSRALYCYQEALSIAREYKNHAEESACLNNIGILLFHVGLYDKALDYLNDAYKIDCTLKDYFNISIELNNIGVILRNKCKYFELKDNYKDALNYLEESLIISRQVGNKNNEEKVLNNIGSVYLDLKDYSKALKYFKAGYDIAKDLQDVEVMGMILNNIASAHLKMGHDDTARRFYEQAVPLGNKIFDVNILWEAYHGLGQCYEQTKEFSHAFQAYEKAIEVIEHVRSQIVMDTCKAGFTRDKIKVYESYIGHLYRMNLKNHSKKLEKDIFQMVERAKARAFLETLRNSQSILRNRLSSKMEEDERMISLKISTLMNNLSREDLNKNEREKLLDQLGHAEDEYVVFLSKVRKEAPELRYVVSPEHTRVEEVQQKLLDEKTALIEYFLGDEQSFMILITKEDFKLFLLP